MTALTIVVSQIKLNLLRNKVVKGAGITIVSNVIARSLSFVFYVWLTWIFVPSDYGYIRYVLSISNLFGQLITSGLPSALTQRIASNRETKTRVVYAFNTVLAMVVEYVLVLVPITFIFVPNRGVTQLMSLLVIAGLSIDAWFYGVLRGFILYVDMAIYRFLANFLQIVLLGIAYLFGISNPNYVLLLYAYIYLLPIIILFLYYYKRYRINLRRLVHNIYVSSSVLKDIVVLSFSFALSAVAYGVISQVDVLFVEKWSGLDSVGIYSALKNLTVIFVFVPFGVTAVLMPKVASLDNLDDVKRYTALAVSVCGIFSIMLLMAILLFGEFAINHLFPAEYRGSVGILYILSLGMTLFTIYTVLSQTWMGLGKPMIPMIILSLSAGINILWNYYLVPNEGMKGAALGTVIAYLTGCFLLGGWTLLKFRSSSGLSPSANRP